MVIHPLSFGESGCKITNHLVYYLVLRDPGLSVKREVLFFEKLRNKTCGLVAQLARAHD